jgi:hypothetical protein
MMSEFPDLPIRAPRVPSSWSPAGVYPDALAERRLYLDLLRVHHLDLTRRFMSVDEGKMYWTDLLVMTVAARSYSLVDGFLSAFDAWNPIVAAPIVRMQINNLVRLAYAAEGNSDDFARYLVEGGELRHRSDDEGKRLTDARLIERASGAHPWVKAVYEATSGWVHLSPALLHSVVQFREDDGSDEPGYVVGVGIPVRRDRIPLRAHEELIVAMTKATEEVFGYIESWEARKGLPPGQTRNLGDDDET